MAKRKSRLRNSQEYILISSTVVQTRRYLNGKWSWCTYTSRDRAEADRPYPTRFKYIVHVYLKRKVLVEAGLYNY